VIAAVFGLAQKATSVAVSCVMSVQMQDGTTIQTHCKNELIDTVVVRMSMHKQHLKIYAMVMRDEYDV